MKSNSVANSILAVVAGFFLASCTQLAVVSEKAPARFQTTAGTNQTVAKEIARAQSLARTQPLVALEAYASAARDSLHELDRNPANIEATALLQFRRGGHLQRNPPGQARSLDSTDARRRKQRADPHGRKDPAKPEQNPALYDLVPIAELSYHGAYVKDDVTKDGIGAPLVAVRHLTPEKAAELYTPPAIYYGVTGFAEFEGSRCILSIQDPLAAETVAVEGRTYPMAANFTASPGDDVGQGEAAKTWTYTTPASGGIRRHRPGRPIGTLQSKQIGRACHPWPDGHAGHVGATDKRFAQRQGYPAQLPVLVLQLSQRLSLSL